MSAVAVSNQYALPMLIPAFAQAGSDAYIITSLNVWQLRFVVLTPAYVLLP